MDKKLQARDLYEKQGVTLSRIAKILGIKDSTLRAWKSRGNWQPKRLEQVNGHNPNSLANLKKGHRKFTKNNRMAVKHGLFANNEGQPHYFDYYEQALYEPIGDTCKYLLSHMFACVMMSNDFLDLSDFRQVELSAIASYHVSSMALNSARLDNVILDNAISYFDGEFFENLNLMSREEFAREYANLMASHVNLMDIAQVEKMVRLARVLLDKALRFSRMGYLKEIDIEEYIAA